MITSQHGQDAISVGFMITIWSIAEACVHLDGARFLKYKGFSSPFLEYNKTEVRFEPLESFPGDDLVACVLTFIKSVPAQPCGWIPTCFRPPPSLCTRFFKNWCQPTVDFCSFLACCFIWEFLTG